MMSLPGEVADAAEAGNLDAVRSWLDGRPADGGDWVNSRDENGWTLLLCCVMPDTSKPPHADLLRLLLRRGADVNLCATHPGAVGGSPLHYAADPDTNCIDPLCVLLEAKPNVNRRTPRKTTTQDNPHEGLLETPLGNLLVHTQHNDDLPLHFLTKATALLRAGATLDAICQDFSADELLGAAEIRRPRLAEEEEFVKVKALVAGVRVAGSWKSFCRKDHRQILRLRSLVARGRARERLTTSRAAKFIVRLGDNGVVWHILSYWRETQ